MLLGAVQIEQRLVQGFHFIDFHSKILELLQKWIQAIRRENWAPKQGSFICGSHFEDSCFVV